MMFLLYFMETLTNLGSLSHVLHKALCAEESGHQASPATSSLWAYGPPQNTTRGLTYTTLRTLPETSIQDSDSPAAS